MNSTIYYKFLQSNTCYLTSYSVECRYDNCLRCVINDQINKELIVNSEIDLLGAENGVNANTLSVGILKNWTENYLLTRTANSNTDNLILSYRNVTVTKKDDYYWVTYGIVINNEINKIFFTGFVFKN